MPIFDIFKKKKKREDYQSKGYQPYGQFDYGQQKVMLPKQAPKQQTTMYDYGQSRIPGVKYIGGQSKPNQTEGYKPYGVDYGQKRVMLPQQQKPAPAPAPAPRPQTNYVAQQQQRQRAQQGQLNQMYKPTNDYLANQRNLMDQRMQYEQQQRAAQEEAINKQFGLASTALRGQIPGLQQGMDLFRQNTLAGVSDLEKAALAQKGQIKDYYGDAQRQAAKASRDSRAQTMQKFASQGAVDSAGYGSHSRAQENIESDFNRTTQQYLKEQAGKLSDIDSQVIMAKRNANTLISQEEAKFRQTLAQIEQQLAGNEIAKGEAIRQAYSQTQQNIFNIQDQLNQLEYQGNAEKLNIQQQIEEMSQGSGLSQQFLSTGVPEEGNERDFIYRLENPDKVTTMQEMLGGNEKTASDIKSLGIVNELVGLNTKGITGGMRNAWSGESRKAEGLLKQLMSELQLEEAKRMKGQGTMTDAEREILRDSIGAFNLDEAGRSRLFDKDFRNELFALKEKLGGIRTQNPLSTNQNLVTQFGG